MIEADVADVMLVTTDFAEVIERYRESESVPVTTTALVTWGGPEDRSDKGKEARLTSSLTVATDATLRMSDRWKIGENWFSTLSISEAQYGVHTVTIARVQGDLRTSGRRVL